MPTYQRKRSLMQQNRNKADDSLHIERWMNNPRFEGMKPIEVAQAVYDERRPDIAYDEFLEAAGVNKLFWRDYNKDLNPIERLGVGANRALRATGQSVNQLLNRVAGTEEDRDRYDAYVASEADIFNRMSEDNPLLTAGNVAGTVAQFAVPGSTLYKGANLAQKGWMARSAVMGPYAALETGLTMPGTDPNTGLLEQKAPYMGLAALLGVGAETAGPAIKAFNQWVKGPKPITDEMMTAYLQAKNIDPSEVGWESIRKMTKEANKKTGENIDEIVSGFNIESQIPTEVGGRGKYAVPLSAGEQELVDSGFAEAGRATKEWNAKQGMYGSRAREKALAFEEAQKQSVGQKFKDLYTDLNPEAQGDRVMRSSQRTSSTLYKDLARQNRNLKNAKNEAYDAVDWDTIAASQPTLQGIIQDMAPGFRAGGQKGRLELGTDVNHPIVHKYMDRLEEISTEGFKEPKTFLNPDIVGPQPRQLYSLKQIEAMRKELGSFKDKAYKSDIQKGGGQGPLMSQVGRRFDEVLDDRIGRGALDISPEEGYPAYTRLKEARAANREYKEFSAGKTPAGKSTALAKLIKQIDEGNTTPETLIESAWGKTGTKSGYELTEGLKEAFTKYNKDGSIRVAGQDTQAFKNYKQAVFWNLFKKSFKGKPWTKGGPRVDLSPNVADDASQTVNELTAVNQIGELLTNRKTELDHLFGPEFSKKLGQFGQSLDELITARSVVSAPSQTPKGLMNFITGAVDIAQSMGIGVPGWVTKSLKKKFDIESLEAMGITPKMIREANETPPNAWAEALSKTTGASGSFPAAQGILEAIEDAD